MKEKITVLFSAGIESVCLAAHYARMDLLVFPVYVRSGFPWERAEILHLKRVWSALKHRYSNILPVRFVKNIMPTTEVSRRPSAEKEIELPLRNFSLIASVLGVSVTRGVYRMAVGSLGMYPFKDNRRVFFDKLQEAINFGGDFSVQIETPFMGLHKHEIIRKFHGKAPLEYTFSCFSPVKGLHCGTCVKCKERREGFLKAGVRDPSRYLYPFS